MPRRDYTSDTVLRTLFRRRVEISTWLESPAKRAHLARINHLIEERRKDVGRAA